MPGWLDRVGRPITYGHLRSVRRWRPTRPCSPATRAAPRCPARDDRSRPRARRPRRRDVERRRGDPAHRGVLDRGRRATARRVVPGAGRHRASVNEDPARGGRVVAVGTTVTRALESAAAPTDGSPPAPAGPTWSSDPTGSARGRRADHRLARTRGFAPAAARGRGRPRPGRAGLRRGARPSDTGGTSSATPASSYASADLCPAAREPSGVGPVVSRSIVTARGTGSRRRRGRRFPGRRRGLWGGRG